jgi:hypothetical protein
MPGRAPQVDGDETGIGNAAPLQRGFRVRAEGLFGVGTSGEEQGNEAQTVDEARRHDDSRKTVRLRR